MFLESHWSTVYDGSLRNWVLTPVGEYSSYGGNNKIQELTDGVDELACVTQWQCFTADLISGLPPKDATPTFCRPSYAGEPDQKNLSQVCQATVPLSCF